MITMLFSVYTVPTNRDRFAHWHPSLHDCLLVIICLCICTVRSFGSLEELFLSVYLPNCKTQHVFHIWRWKKFSSFYISTCNFLSFFFSFHLTVTSREAVERIRFRRNEFTFDCMIYILDWNFCIGSLRLEQVFLPSSRIRIDFIRIQRKDVRREGHGEKERKKRKKWKENFSKMDGVERKHS